MQLFRELGQHDFSLHLNLSKMLTGDQGPKGHRVRSDSNSGEKQSKKKDKGDKTLPLSRYFPTNL